jgi:hypothetical protein
MPRADAVNDESVAHPPAAQVTPAELLRTGAACPQCGRSPAIRVGQGLAGLVARVLRPGAVALSYQCQWRGCGHVYTITADELGRFGSREPAKSPSSRAVADRAAGEHGPG